MAGAQKWSKIRDDGDIGRRNDRGHIGNGWFGTVIVSDVAYISTMAAPDSKWLM